ncbi:response regulator [Anatilimnocola floriformis]|uniref:response regulator n=1 Tax=Anatilimnocola floriformis TaxID=2948575 RepID=UPI0020C22B01|nr:response regulator [Anatilimnocola floriformis]
MSPTIVSSEKRDRVRIDSSVWLGFVAVFLFFLSAGGVAYVNTRILRRNADSVAKTHETIVALENVISIIKDAETGQRGYLLTGDTKYLAPYNVAINRVEQRLQGMERLVGTEVVQAAKLRQIREEVANKLSELAETIDIRQKRGFDEALEVVVTDRGKQSMDAIRTHVEAMQTTEMVRRADRLREMDQAYLTAVASGVLTGLLGIVLSSVVAYLVRRAMLTRARQEWLLNGQSGLSREMVGDPTIDQLSNRVLKFLAEYLNAQAGIFFARDEGQFKLLSTFAVPADSGVLQEFSSGEGLLGKAADDGKPSILNDIPEGYLVFGSGLGRSKPRHLAIAPFSPDSETNAVVELGFLEPPDSKTTEFLQNISESIGVAVKSAHYRAHLHNLLEETQRQAEELQAQSEELRVGNEELEEQSSALKESQTRLEQQQVELEQTNSQLEEHAQTLETQRDDLARTQASLERQARELEQASQYKSDFLANMSHELRTPLNSSLILAKLLGDNPNRNLTPEQVQFARNIESAGNDLLNLINDILDLSKIEAGHMEVRPESVRLSQLIEDVARTFLPVATQKGLEFKTGLAADCPKIFETDGQRLEQILRNLLSNAFKFTERGSVQLKVSQTANQELRFAVSDTGIGIPAHQQQIIFEAFRQADGTTNRKYGGTGLGLSISRELTRLLGGRIELESTPGGGSTFTITLPLSINREVVQRKPNAPPEQTDFNIVSHTPQPVVVGPIGEGRAAVQRLIEDDRERLSAGRRLILLVEDDLSFARILYDLAHELNFDALIATTAEEGLQLATQHLPSAIILDVGLPDQSGLTVLDRLKRDARTRHLPVHVISASDYAQTALSLGAVGYMLKPVKREELVDVLHRIESRLLQKMRRVLVVEDDPRQLDSLQKLLGSHEVSTTGARTAAECLSLLKDATFDCMVLDLTLPDTSGYALLETLSKEQSYSFPPVIVYTGRELSVDEEQRLRRYSKSIIIKGAKSPERLLDEVTLFLHQMVATLPAEQRRMLETARSREADLEGRRILVVEDDVRNVFALTSILEPRGAIVQIARNGREALTALEKAKTDKPIDLVLMDIMMPEMDGITCMREIRKNPAWREMPIIALTAKAMKDDQEQCLSAGANDYIPKPLDVEKLLSLVRVWMPR